MTVYLALDQSPAMQQGLIDLGTSPTETCEVYRTSDMFELPLVRFGNFWARRPKLVTYKNCQKYTLGGDTSLMPSSPKRNILGAMKAIITLHSAWRFLSGKAILATAGIGYNQERTVQAFRLTQLRYAQLR